MLLILCPPILGGLALFGINVFTMLISATIIAMVNTAVGTLRLGLASAMVFILLIPICVLSGTVPLVGTCLIALACIGAGTALTWIRFSGALMIPLGMAFAMTQPPSVSSTMLGSPSHLRYLLGIMVAAVICAIWAASWVHILVGSKNVPFSMRQDRSADVEYTIVMTILVSASMWWVLRYGLENHGVWLILTLLMVFQLDRNSSLHRIVHRIGGTIVGSLTAVAIVGLGEPKWFIITMLITMLIGFFSFFSQEPYAVFTFFLTNVILLAMSGTDPVANSFDRLGFTLLGVCIASVALAIEPLLFRRLRRAKHVDQASSTSP